MPPKANALVVSFLVLVALAWPPSVEPALGRDGARVRSAADPGRQVALGVATPNGRSLDVFDRFSTSIGRRPAIWVIWSAWGSPDSASFPTRMANGLADRGVAPMIWWEPMDPRAPTAPTYARHANISSGAHDGYIRQFARDARDFGRTVYLRFAQEANGKYFPWSIHRFDNSPATFIAAWRHVRDIFRSEGATNVQFVWSVAKQTCRDCNPYLRMYPGDDYVDVIGFSTYNWGAMRRWVPLRNGAARVTRLLRQISAKPIIVAETGCNPNGGDKAAWIREGYPEVYARLPDIEAIVYLNADLRPVNHPDWRLSSPGAALAAYAKIARMEAFRGRSIP